MNILNKALKQTERAMKGAFVLPMLHCNKCKWNWFPRKPKAPKVCPRCKRPSWNIIKPK